eukprot:38250_1
MDFARTSSFRQNEQTSVLQYDPDTDFVVTGYIRESQSLFPSQTYYNIIGPIVHLCKKYYFFDVADDELKEYRKKYKLLHDMYCKIDAGGFGDLDFDEFGSGIRKLNISLDEHEMKQIFNVMDHDQSGYIDLNKFISFLIYGFNSFKLRTLMRPIVSDPPIRPKNDRFDLFDYEWYSMPCLCYQETLNDIDIFLHELEQRKQHPEFCKVSNCENWNKYEVAGWRPALDNMNLSQYIEPFAEECIDGDILLHDVDENILKLQYGIRSVYAAKILRERDKLKHIYQSNQDEQMFKLHQMISSKEEEIETLKLQIQALNDRSLKQWMNAENVYDKELYLYLITNNIDSVQRIKKLKQEKFDEMVRKWRMDRFAQIKDMKKRKSIDKLLLKLETSWRKAAFS